MQHQIAFEYGTIRREYLDHNIFWNTQDLERKLADFRQYYNRERIHPSSGEDTPAVLSVNPLPLRAKISNYSWLSHCDVLFQTPIAA